MANLGDISKINLPNGNVVNIKDATARAQANWNTNNGVKNFATENNFSHTGYFKEVSINGQLKGEVTIHIDSVTSTDTDANTCALIVDYVDGTSSRTRQIPRGEPYTWTTDFGTHIIKDVCIYPSDNYVHSSGDTVTVTNLMVCPKSLYVADSTYEPYALPNTKITPELIELVDSGAKNLVNSTSGSGTRWIDMPVDIPAGEYAVSFATLSTTWEVSANQLQISFMDSNYDIVTDGYTYINYTTKNGVYKLNNTCKIIRLYASPTSVSGKVVTYTNMMLCTKAAWDVSQKFVPYRPTYEETVEQVVENKNNILLYQPTYEKYQYSVNSINTYEYSGVSFTVPSNQVVDFTICYQYNGGNTTFNPSICVADSSTNIGINSTIVAENTQENSQTDKSYWCLQLNGITPRRSSNTTYYIWVKSGNTTTNDVCLMKRRIE